MPSRLGLCKTSNDDPAGTSGGNYSQGHDFSSQGWSPSTPASNQTLIPEHQHKSGKHAEVREDKDLVKRKDLTNVWVGVRYIDHTDVLLTLSVLVCHGARQYAAYLHLFTLQAYLTHCKLMLHFRTSIGFKVEFRHRLKFYLQTHTKEKLTKWKVCLKSMSHTCGWPVFWQIS